MDPARSARRLAVPALLLSALLGACKNDLDRVAAVEVPRDAPDRVTSEAEYLFSDSARVTNRLRAGRVEEFGTGTAQRTELKEGLELTFFDRKGRQNGVLTARTGRILADARRMEVERDVVFINARGERLETEYLVWLQDSARINTDRAVRITRASDILHGEGLDAAEDLSSYTIRRITGVLYPADADSLR